MASESSEPPKSEPPPPNKEEPKQETEEASPIEEADPSGGPKEKPAEQGRQPTKGTTSALATPADQTKYGSGNARTEAAKAPEKPGQGEKPKFFASPLARKIALERGIPLGQIKGSGPEGRIVKVSGSTFVTLSLSDMEGDAETIIGRRRELQRQLWRVRWSACHRDHPHIRCHCHTWKSCSRCAPRVRGCADQQHASDNWQAVAGQQAADTALLSHRRNQYG